MIKSKQLRAGRIPQSEIDKAKKKEAERVARIEKDPRYIQKMDEELLNEYDFDYQGRKEMAKKRQLAMQSNPRLYDAWKRQNDKRNAEIKAQQEYEREQERLREEAEERRRAKENDVFSNVMSGLSTVASLIPGVGTAVSTGLDVARDAVNLGRDTFGGELKKQKRTRKVKGAGLFDIFTPNKSYNNVSTKTMKQYGDFPVIQLRIMRTPIMKILNTVINVISLGKWNDLLKKHGYDDLFHLALVATVQTPTEQKQIVIEKNEVINVSTKFTVNDKTETLEVPLNGIQTTVNKMLADGLQKVGVDKWFLYHPLNNNCQSFISYILQTLGLYNMQTRTFLYQSMEAIKQELPSYVKSTMKAVTDIGAVASKLMGKGLEDGEKLHIHSIKINKQVPVEKQLEHVRNITKSNKNRMMKEMKNHNNYRIIPKTKFHKDSFRTKKINSDISIVFGKLKD
jgi:hypothetical protein